MRYILRYERLLGRRGEPMSERSDVDEDLLRIHAVCGYLRSRPERSCKLCPATVTDPEFGECIPGCVALAREVINLAVHGHPHGAKGIALHGQKWRKHFNDE
jgi:hypothetical protein